MPRHGHRRPSVQGVLDTGLYASTMSALMATTGHVPEEKLQALACGLLAKRPLEGREEWDAFKARINESQAKANAAENADRIRNAEHRAMLDQEREERLARSAAHRVRARHRHQGSGSDQRTGAHATWATRHRVEDSEDFLVVQRR